MSQNVFKRSGTGSFVIVGPEAQQPPQDKPGPARPNDDKARKLFEQAARELERQALPAAETSLRLSLSFNPDDAEARELLERVKGLRDAQRRAGSNLKIS